MTLEDVLPSLQARLGPIVHPPVDPVYSDYDLADHRPKTSNLKQAAVLVPLVLRDHGVNVILTRRSLGLPTHAGQIAFPGGRCEADDKDVGVTALREAQEEIGLDPTYVTLIGVLDAYETVTRFAVTPVIGFVDPAATFVPDPREVAEIFEVPLSFLMDPVNHVPRSKDYNGAVRRYYAMPYGEYYVWGATAGMLRALYLRVFA